MDKPRYTPIQPTPEEEIALGLTLKKMVEEKEEERDSENTVSPDS